MTTQSIVWLVALPLIVALGACSSREQKVEENILPTDYKSSIMDTVRSRLDDPTGIRDAAISDPVLKPVAGATRYVVCFRYNAKEAGRYAGVRESAVVFYAGRINQFINPTGEQCGGMTYQPFPELQKLCRTLNCQDGS